MRIKTIDIFRGFIICGMICIHLIDWWLIEEDSWFANFARLFVELMFASGFLWISGVSSMIWYRKSVIKATKSKNYNTHIMNREFLIRSLLLLVIATVYNLAIAIAINDITWIWAWFMLFALAFSMLMSFPLFKTSKTFKLIFAIIIFALNQILVVILLPYEGQSNVYGAMFHILFNPLVLYPILNSYFYFIIGMLVGDLLFEIYQIDDIQKRKRMFLTRFFIPSLVISTLLIVFGCIFLADLFFNLIPFSWVPFSIAAIFIMFSIILIFEVYGCMETKKSYRFLYYFSYYSLTIYLGHFFLYFLFDHLLSFFYFAIIVTSTLILLGLFVLRPLYKKWSSLLSLKVQLGKLAAFLALKNEFEKTLIHKMEK